jgi:GalNAc5-diNAcBac-PP-undecaprenol beta-1,3-glucosyltransferase
MFKYSIIIPTHKRVNLLERAINSIKKQVGNVACEIIVVSDVVDNLTDNLCSQMLEKQDIYVRRSGKPGPAESRNLGLQICSGDAVIFLDDDDELTPDCLENIEKYRNHEEPFLYFNAEIIIESRFQGRVIEHGKSELNLENNLNKFIYVKNQLPICNIVFPINKIKDINFESCMKAYEDWDYLLSVFDKSMPRFAPFTGSIIHQVNDDTSDRRGSSIEAISNHAILDYLFVYKKHPVMDNEIKIGRNNLISICGINIGAEYL